MDRWIGGNPLAVILRLAVLSIIVGVVLSALGITPDNFIARITLLAQRIYDLGFGAFEWLGSYLLLGALVVVPIWLLTRLFGGGRADKDGDDRPRRRS
ncbi:MAG: DUF6460 domain-containing protein [Pseudomonadota bacterium]